MDSGAKWELTGKNHPQMRISFTRGLIYGRAKDCAVIEEDPLNGSLNLMRHPRGFFRSGASTTIWPQRPVRSVRILEETPAIKSTEIKLSDDNPFVKVNVESD
jgi:hypothetical protein